ncbi:hypothetical protein A2U01_0104106, partial [Trifolium medium]|nr:hypothetical protein [Trifolium medium]
MNPVSLVHLAAMLPRYGTGTRYGYGTGTRYG